MFFVLYDKKLFDLIKFTVNKFLKLAIVSRLKAIEPTRSQVPKRIQDVFSLSIYN